MLLDLLEEVLPGWALRRRHWKALFAATFSMVDGLIAYARDAVKAAQPGQVDGDPDLGGFPSVDALPLIGRDRGIVQGTEESYGDYASRLRRWRTIRASAGTSFGLLEQVRALLSPQVPRVRLVSDHGYWWTIEGDGTRSYHTPSGVGGFTQAPDGANAAIATPAHTWTWDGAPPRGDVWLIIYCHDLVPGIVFSEGFVYGATGPQTTSYRAGGRWGLDLGPRGAEFLEKLRDVLQSYGSAGVLCRAVIFTFDEGSFDPETPGPYPAAGMPDGLWGKPWKLVGGTPVPSRPAFARYWNPGA